MRKTILEKRQARLIAKRDSLKSKALASEDVNEVRSINTQLEELNDEIAEATEEIEAIEAEERSAANKTEERVTPPEGAVLVNGNIRGSFKAAAEPTQKRENADPYSTLEYRQAFMRYAQTGEKIPETLIRRDGMPQNTTQLGATIPTTTLNEFINEIRKVYGNLYSKVRKLNIPGAVKVPISELQATFKWITEDTVAPRTDGGTINEFVEFSYNMAEIRVSQTLLSSIVALDVFEREIVRIMLIPCKLGVICHYKS